VCAAGRGAAHPPAHAVAVPVGQCDDRLQRVEAQPLAGLVGQVPVQHLEHLARVGGAGCRLQGVGL